ncbi:MAG TPA: hypothetical protein VMF91_04120 [Bryobacteraceae bacterium]|nr:hypothetical protein [Bryobacteraceae bacterium]
MRILLWLFLVVLFLSFLAVIAQQVAARTAPDQKYEQCRVEAEALESYEVVGSWVPFALIYWLLCLFRSRSTGPVERLILAVFLTVGLCACVFWAWMAAVFHSSDAGCANAPLPFPAFLAAWTSPLFGIGVVILIGLIWNYARVRHVARAEA